MSANDLFRVATHVLLFLVFLNVLAQAVRRPYQTNIDMLLLFGDFALLVIEREARFTVPRADCQILQLLDIFLVIALPYLLLRVGNDFIGVPRLAQHAAAVLLGLLIVGISSAPERQPFLIVAAFYFIGFCAFAAVVFVRSAQASRGTPRRRLEFIALGTIVLALVLGSLFLPLISRSLTQFATTLGGVLTVLVSLCFLIGFAPPAFIRRSWQATQIRAMLKEIPNLARYPDRATIIELFGRNAALSLGASRALIALWEPTDRTLHLNIDGQTRTLSEDQGIVGRAFATQTSVFTDDLYDDYPEFHATYQDYDAQAALAVPITRGETRYGVLVAYANRAPMFAADNLEFARLLADQIAVVLENHRLIHEVARLRGRDEALHLKNEFLSSAAHELKTPLTVVLGQAQLIELGLQRHPERQVRIEQIQAVSEAAKELNELLGRLLSESDKAEDIARSQDTTIDLVEVVRDACERAIKNSSRHRCEIVTPSSLNIYISPEKLRQVVGSLTENSVLYSPEGGNIWIRLEYEGESVHLTVQDEGIGIPAADLPHIFERFYRGSNVTAQRFPGFGLNLYIAKSIVEQYHGRIWATSIENGNGATFHVVLPILTAPIPGHETDAWNALLDDPVRTRV